MFGKQSIESRLKVVLPDDLGTSLMDGVVLCHLANHIRPRSVISIHVPSPAVVSPAPTHPRLCFSVLLRGWNDSLKSPFNSVF